MLTRRRPVDAWRGALSALLCLFIALSLAGETLKADSLYIVDLQQPLHEMIYHLRLRPDRFNETNVSLYWNFRDSANYTRADFSIPALADIDQTDVAMINCRVTGRNEGVDTEIGRYDERLSYGRGRDVGVSTVLLTDDNGSRLCFGDRSLRDGFVIALDALDPGAIAFVADRKTDVLAHSLITRHYPRRRHFDGEPAIDGANTVAGVWTYLDRDTDPKKVSGAPGYDIAVTPSENGTYLILFWGEDRDGWRRGDVKGVLRPTPFVGHYDLEWYDMSGRRHSLDTSADLLLDARVLRLNFPLLGSSLRFRRPE